MLRPADARRRPLAAREASPPSPSHEATMRGARTSRGGARRRSPSRRRRGIFRHRGPPSPRARAPPPPRAHAPGGGCVTPRSDPRPCSRCGYKAARSDIRCGAAGPVWLQSRVCPWCGSGWTMTLRLVGVRPLARVGSRRGFGLPVRRSWRGRVRTAPRWMRGLPRERTGHPLPLPPLLAWRGRLLPLPRPILPGAPRHPGRRVGGPEGRPSRRGMGFRR